MGVLAYGVDTSDAATTAALYQGTMVLNVLLGFAAALPRPEGYPPTVRQ